MILIYRFELDLVFFSSTDHSTKEARVLTCLLMGLLDQIIGDYESIFATKLSIEVGVSFKEKFTEKKKMNKNNQIHSPIIESMWLLIWVRSTD